MSPPSLPPAWAALLAPEFDKPYFKELQAFLEKERGCATVYPPPDQVFSAFTLTPPEAVKVLILGQDPYHGPGQAHGLAFSVAPGIALPPSLNNMFKEMTADLGLQPPRCGSLIPWARRGVMLLNAVLTVRAGEANSHASKGWEKFTDAVIRALDSRAQPLVFVLWGGYARKKAKLINSDGGKRHRVLEGTHPSPLSAHQGFFGSKPYSKINQLLAELKQPPVDWDLCREEAAPAAAAAEAAPEPTVKDRRAPDKTRARRERAAPPPNSDALVLAEALQKGDPPPPQALQRALQLATWDALTDDERLVLARAVERALPAAFTLEGVAPCAQGALRRAVASYRDAGGARFALIPGGAVRLGYSRGAVRLSRGSRDLWHKKFQLPAKKGGWQQVTVGPERWLERFLTRPRTVTLPPLLLEVEPTLTGGDLLGRAQGADAHQRLQAALVADGLRLPDGDEWEHGCAAGARTLFRWGDEWPVDLAAPGAGRPGDDDDEGGDDDGAAAPAAAPTHPEREPNAFGLRFPLAGEDGGQPAEATSDPEVFRRGPLVEERRCFEDQAIHASSWTHDLRELGRQDRWLTLLRGALLRRARPVLPLARR